MTDTTQNTSPSPVWAAIRGEPLTIFLVCLAGWGLSNLDQSLFGYAIPGIRAEFGADLEQVSWILSASFAFAAFMTVAIGVLADQFGRKRLFIITLALSALLVGLQGFASSLTVLGIIRVLAFGVSNGLAPIVLTYTAEASPARYRGVFVGVLNCGYPLGWFAGSLMAAPIMASYGWRFMFLPALAVVPLALLLSRWLPESRRFRAEQSSHAAGVAKPSGAVRIKALFSPELRRRTIFIMIGNFLFGGAYAGTAFYFPTFYHEVRGYSIEDATYIVGLAYGIGLVGYVLASFVGEFVLTRRNTVALWLCIGSVAMLALVWLPRGFTQDVIAFSLMAAFFYAVSSVFGVFGAEIFPTRVRATAVAVSASFAMYVGFAVFPLLVAWAVGHVGWQWAFTLSVVPAALMAAFAVMQIENSKSGVDLEELAS